MIHARHFGGFPWFHWELVKGIDHHALLEEQAEFYFAFVEDVSDLWPEGAIDAPGGGTLKRNHPVFERKPVRFRTSGLAVRDFFERERIVEPLEPLHATGGGRDHRRGQLREFFHGMPLPILDIIAPRKDEEFRLVEATLVPTSWSLLLLRNGEPGEADWPVYRGEPDPAFPGDFGPAWLERILPVHPVVEERLRDIFSLNHVADADMAAERA